MPSQAADIFVVKDISISGEGKSATQAREAAISEGEVKAYDELIKKLTPSYMHHSLPEAEPEVISSLVQGMEINTEKVTSNHYEAVVNISFNPVLIKAHLNNQGIAMVASKEKPILVIPVMEDEQGVPVIGSTSIWQQSWGESVSNTPIVDFLLPKWNKEDASLIDFEAITASGYFMLVNDPLYRLRKKYGADEVLLAYMSKKISDIDSSAYEISVKLITYDDEDTKRKSLVFKSRGEESLNDLIKRASDNIVSMIENSWKLESENKNIEKAKIRALVPINGQAYWHFIKTRLQMLNFIDNFQVASISVGNVVIDIDFHSSFSDLVKSMAEYGLYLQNNNSNILLTYAESPPEWYIQQYQMDIEYNGMVGDGY
ncbi:DUF2066 domain-containing protein [Rickettsiales bacterium]|nr:DUF2066 domain-containing protein [Rickettsiales bacterium]